MIYSRQPEQLTVEERKFLSRLNTRLAELEKGIKAEACEIDKNLKMRVRDKNDWIGDYEIECTVQFILKETDPEYG